jgi:pyruvate dehydrogenase E2 component (dihydrolipoamide acetyltransferase)
MAEIINMPRQGQSVESCILTEWKVAEGDSVKTGDVLCEVETDKASFEVEATADGTILKLFCANDDDVPVLEPIAVIGKPGEAIPDNLNSAAPSEEEPKSEDSAKQAEENIVLTSEPIVQTATKASADCGISPRARNTAQKKGIDATTLAGTGPAGRIIERDVLSAAEKMGNLSPVAKDLLGSSDLNAPTSGSGIGGRILASDLSNTNTCTQSESPLADKKTIPVKGIRKIVSERMLESLQTTAQLTLNSSADARSIMSYRQKLKNSAEQLELNKISINDLLLYTVSRILPSFPELNAHFLGKTIEQYNTINLGFAVDTPRGLMVPVIKNAQRLSLKALSLEAKRLVEACLTSKIEPEDLTGGTFTLTNLGAMGIETFTPVLNAPQVGILGVGSVQLKPIQSNEEVVFHPYMSLSLTFNHCATDGAPAAKFVQAVSQAIANFELTLAN